MKQYWDRKLVPVFKCCEVSYKSFVKDIQPDEYQEKESNNDETISYQFFRKSVCSVKWYMKYVHFQIASENYNESAKIHDKSFTLAEVTVAVAVMEPKEK